MRAINVLLAILISVALGLGVFNLGLSLLPAFKARIQINQFDSKLGWSKKPNFTTERSTSEIEIEFKINSLGLRDDPMPNTDKGPNTFRVMMLGDSFVLGYTVDRRDLFVDHLENWWSAEERRVDVINAGTEGYSTDQEVAWFIEQGSKYDPDLVLIFPYENDIYWNGQTSYARFPKPRFSPSGALETDTLADPGSVAASSWALMRFVESFKTKSNPMAAHMFTTPGLPDVQLFNEWGPLLKEEPAFLAECLARTQGALAALQSECARIEAELFIVPIPSESAIHAASREAFRTSAAGLRGLDDDLWDPNLPVDHFLRMGRELGIRTLDARSTLRASGANEPLYFDDEWHFNPRGNEVFATFLHDNLDSAAVFPAEHSAKQSSGLVAAEPEGGIATWMMVFAALWLALGTSFCVTYREDAGPAVFLKVGAMLAFVFSLVLGIGRLMRIYPELGQALGVTFFVGIVGFVIYKMGRRVGTIFELLRALTMRGHWYLMPLVVVLLTIGSLLVVAASSPLIAPFIYTLF